MSEESDRATGASSDAKAPPQANSGPSGWRSPLVIAAVITAIGAIVVGYFQRPVKDSPKQKFILTGHVFSKNDSSGVEGANLSLALAGQGFLSNKSREQGAFVFSELTSLDGTLTVSADGYGTKTFDITPLYSNRTLNVELLSTADKPSANSQVPINNVNPSIARDEANTGCKTNPNPSTARDEANTGWWYETGQIGNGPDYAEAMKHYLKAVENGDIIANWNIARLYERGLGVRQDMETARLWYKKAADQGDARSQEALKHLGQNP